MGTSDVLPRCERCGDPRSVHDSFAPAECSECECTGYEGAKPTPTPPSSLTEEQRLNLDVIQGVNGFLRENLPWGERALLDIIDTLTRENAALRDELNAEHPYRELWEAAEEELGRLRATLALSTRSDGSERDTGDTNTGD